MNERKVFGFQPPEEAARDLEGLAGDLSKAGSILDGEASPVAPANQEAESSADEGLFDVHTRARIDLGDPTVEGEISELAEADEPPTTYEITRESIVKGIEGAFESWYKFGGTPGLRLPRDFDHFSRFNRDIDGTLDQLTKIKLDMIEFGRTSGGRTEKGHNLGRSLQPLLIPWELFSTHINQDSLENLTVVYKGMQEKQGIEEHVLDDPHMFDASSFSYFDRNFERRFGASEVAPYLMHRLREDGWWGVILAQTQSQVGQSGNNNLDELSNERRGGYRVNGYRADALGILEWIALSLQEDPHTFTGRRNLMMGNYEVYDKGTWDKPVRKRAIPWGVWDEKNQRLDHNWVSPEKVRSSEYVIRLAIHPGEEKAEEEEERK